MTDPVKSDAALDMDEILEPINRAMSYVPLRLYDEEQKPGEEALGSLIAALLVAQQEREDAETSRDAALIRAADHLDHARAAEATVTRLHEALEARDDLLLRLRKSGLRGRGGTPDYWIAEIDALDADSAGQGFPERLKASMERNKDVLDLLGRDETGGTFEGEA